MRCLALLLCCTLTFVVHSEEGTKPITFAKSELGKVPSGWTTAKTGPGEGNVWKVAEDNSTPSKSGYALAQTAAGPSPLYNMCILNDSSFQDGTVSVRVKAVTGKIDQGGGLVWRYQDADNYYVCRYNPLEENFRVYYVKDGKRKQLATKDEVEGKAGTWFNVSIKHDGKKITCSLDGKPLLEIEDATFADAGKVGLWTKADAVSHFEQLTIVKKK